MHTNPTTRRRRRIAALIAAALATIVYAVNYGAGMADAHNALVTCTQVTNIDGGQVATITYLDATGAPVGTYTAPSGVTAHQAPAGTAGYTAVWPDGYRVPNGPGWQPMAPCPTITTTTTTVAATTTTAARTTTTSVATTTTAQATTTSTILLDEGGPSTTIPTLPLCPDGSPGTIRRWGTGPADWTRDCPAIRDRTGTTIQAEQRLPATGPQNATTVPALALAAVLLAVGMGLAIIGRTSRRQPATVPTRRPR